MLSFRPITLSDRPLLHQAFWNAEGHGSEYSFANLFFWGEQQLCDSCERPLILSQFGSWTAYLYPRSTDYVELLRQDAAQRGLPLRFWGMTQAETIELQQRYPGGFSVQSARNSFDYVYQIQRLCELGGKKLQSKRNHCNRFMIDHPDYRIRELTPELLAACRSFTERWYEAHAHLHEDSDYEWEHRAIERAFSHFEALHMEGILLETEEGMVGFSMGNRIREDTFDVNYEKALASVNGAYPMVNREFARHIREKYPEIRFINREDDMGIAGLRRAKESYYPDVLLEKYVAEAVV